MDAEAQKTGKSRRFSVKDFINQPVSVWPPSDLSKLSLFPEHPKKKDRGADSDKQLSLIEASKEILKLAKSAAPNDYRNKWLLASADLAAQIGAPLLSAWLVSNLQSNNLGFITLTLAGLGSLWAFNKIREGIKEIVGPRVYSDLSRAIDKRLFETVASLSSASISTSEVNAPLTKVREQTNRITNFILRNIEIAGAGALFCSAAILAGTTAPLMAGALLCTGVLRFISEHRSAERFDRAEKIVSGLRRTFWGERWNTINSEGINEIKNYDRVDQFADRVEKQSARIDRPANIERKMRLADLFKSEVLSYTTMIIGIASALHPSLGGTLNPSQAIKLVGLVIAMEGAQSGFTKLLYEHLKDLTFVRSFLKLKEKGTPEVKQEYQYLRLPKGHIPEITFDNVSFIVEVLNKKNEKEKKTIVNAVNLTIKPGQMIGLCGPSGNGKTSLIKLLTLENEPTDGNVLIDGKPISNYHPRDIKRSTLYLPQRYYNFGGLTVKEAIEVGLSDPEQMSEAISRAQAQFVAEDPNVLNARMWKDAPNGRDFSGGETQRIALARTMGRKSGIIIVDEPTAQLDEHNASAVLNSLRKLANDGNIVILISHDLLNLAVCDEIVYIESGAIKQKGTHLDLVKAGGDYANMWQKNENRRRALNSICPEKEI